MSMKIFRVKTNPQLPEEKTVNPTRKYFKILQIPLNNSNSSRQPADASEWILQSDYVRDK